MSISGSRKNSSKEGFTLMEVLIAVALSSVIMLALFGMFDSVVNVASSIKSNEGESYEERIFESILFDDLRSVYISTKKEYAFSGKSGSFVGVNGEFMTFCTTATLGHSNHGPDISLQRVEYLLKGGGEVKVVYRRERLYCGLSGKWGWSEVPIVSGISSMRIEYMDTDRTFISEWNKAGYPLAIKIDIEFEKKSGHSFLLNLSQMAKAGI